MVSETRGRAILALASLAVRIPFLRPLVQEVLVRDRAAQARVEIKAALRGQDWSRVRDLADILIGFDVWDAEAHFLKAQALLGIARSAIHQAMVERLLLSARDCAGTAAQIDPSQLPACRSVIGAINDTLTDMWRRRE